MSGLFRRLLAASLLVAALTGPVAAHPAAASSVRVIAANLQFTPARLEVSVGDTVVWQAGDDDHTVTARDGSFDSSDRGLMAAGDEFRWRFRAPGTYPYFCRVHGNRGMQGVIVVADPAAPSTTTSTRPVPVSAAATTSTTGAALPTTSAPSTTTTTRPLATSSTTSIAMATPSTTLAGAPAVPEPPPALNPAAPVLGSLAPDQGLSASEAASRHSSGPGGAGLAVAAALGALVVLGGVGGGLRHRARRRRKG